MSKDIIHKIASHFNINKDELYEKYKYEKKNKLNIFEKSKSNLEEFKNNNSDQSYYGLSLCVNNKKKMTNDVTLILDDKYESIFKKYNINSNDREILYFVLEAIKHNLYIETSLTSDDVVKNYILNVPDYGLLCTICNSPLNFETKQTRSADEADKTYAICTKNRDHIFSTDRFTLDSEKIDVTKETNILLDR